MHNVHVLGWLPLGLGLVIEVESSELSCVGRSACFTLYCDITLICRSVFFKSHSTRVPNSSRTTRKFASVAATFPCLDFQIQMHAHT